MYTNYAIIKGIGLPFRFGDKIAQPKAVEVSDKIITSALLSASRASRGG
jgi:hypothetical protein